MSELLSSLKADLLDRRFLPFLAVAGVALLAALGYAIFASGSSSSSNPTPPRVHVPAGEAGGVAITQASPPDQAVAETTGGAYKQHYSGQLRNPFAALPGAPTTNTSSSSSSAGKSGSNTTSSGGSASHATNTSSGQGSSPSSSGGSGSGGSSGSGGASTPTTTAPTTTTPLKPVSPPKKIYIYFHTTVQFGVVPAPVAGGTQPPPQLKTYKDIPIHEAFPDKGNPQLLYLGVNLKTRDEAVFELTGAATVHGSAPCRPSPSECRGFLLRAGQTETMDVIEATGQPVTYELKLVSITKSVSTSANSAKVASAARSSTQRRALAALARRRPRLSLAGLAGVLAR